MEVTIERVATLDPALLAGCDFAFDVTEEAVPPFDGPGIAATRPVAPRLKSYPFDTAFETGRRNSERMIALARVDGQVAGYLVCLRGWNQCAEIHRLEVDRQHRMHGVARRLVDAARGWAGEQGLPALRLKTQADNVPACRFYARYGFTLAGADRMLYRWLDGPQDETALFWYLPLRP